MANRYIVAFDLGTGGVKAALFDESLRIHGRAFVEYSSRYPKPGWVEQDPEGWWSGMRGALRSLLSTVSVQPKEIVVVGIDAMAPVLVPCTADGTALRPAMIWMDRRSGEESALIEREIGPDLFRISGNHNDPSNLAPKAMWLKRNEPEVYEKADLLHGAVGYLVHRMTGEACLDVTQCGLSQLCNSRESTWDESLIRGCALDRVKLPPILESTAVAGTVTAAASRETGLAAGTPVVAGAMDNVAAGLGLGVIEANEAYVSAGTATNMCVCTDEAKYVHEFHLYRHIRPGRFLSVAGVDFGGAGTKWIKNILGDIDYADIDRMVTESLGSGLPMVYLPYMVGQRAPLWNDATTGVLLGIHPSVDRRDLLRSMMEGNGIALARVVDLFRRNGFDLKEARLTGGASHSAANCRIFSDALGMPLQVFDESDVAVRGAAMTAAIGVGIYSSFNDLIEQAAPRSRILPDADRTAYYNEISLIFQSVYGKLQEEFHALAAVRARYHERREETP